MTVSLVAPVFSSGWPVNWNGTVPGTADTSLTAPSNVTTLGTVGGDTKIVQPGGISTRATATFTVAVVSSSQTITVADTTGFKVSDFVWVNDGAHAIFGTVTAISGTTGGTLTVATTQINIGASGNTMAIGAFVQFCAPISSHAAKIEQISCNQVASNSASCYVNVFKYDGAAYHFMCQFAYTSNVTFTSALQGTPQTQFFTNEMLPVGWSLRCSVTASGGVSAYRVTALGGYYQPA